MRSSDLLCDAFGRIRDLVDSTVDGLDGGILTWRPDPEANSIAWLIWHLTRVEDDHVAGVAQRDQAYTGCGFAERFSLPFDPGDIGYGHTSEQVGLVAVAGPDLLIEYHQCVAAASMASVAAMNDDDLDRVVDHHWDPPVTAGVRLVSVVSDCLQHLGQAAYIRGLAERRPG